jgi:hypothetical protein
MNIANFYQYLTPILMFRFDFSDLHDVEGQRRILSEEQHHNIVSKLHHILKPFLLRRLKLDGKISVCIVEHKSIASLIDTIFTFISHLSSGSRVTYEKRISCLCTHFRAPKRLL